MRSIAGVALAALLLPAPVLAEGDTAAHRAGDFDYYVMALSWSPNWCALEGDGRGAPECDRGAGRAFTLHGLWPQYEEGWPDFCRTTQRDPSRGESEAMADIMGSSGLAWYQWKKHGRCAGLPARDWYATMRRAYGSIAIPEVFAGLDRRITLPASVVEDAFLEANPKLKPDQITITCDEGMVQEVRLCLTKDLEPRRCGPDVIRDCRLKDAVMTPIR
ncbi:MAG TPA: ribonuclease T2 [Gemmobacter sp.]|nr:ribonuclease T2 [Gemmobacter sp.]